jgi:ABC-2 type transport system ATP-binding protein
MKTIEVLNLSKTYRSGLRRIPTPVLREVSLVVPQGVIFGLMGPNGAGKTTFIKSLLDIVRPDSGTISLLGKSPDHPLARKDIGYLPEKIHFVPGTTALSFLRGTARLRKLPIKDSELCHGLKRLGLEGVGPKKVQTFSKGMKQRLGVVAALLGQPKLLILDEPTDGIDPIGRQSIRQIIDEENQRGATVFLNSHLLAETEKICQRVGVLVQGKIVLDGAIEDIRREKNSWEIRFDSVPNHQALLEIGFKPRDEDAHAFTYNNSNIGHLNQALDRARATGACIVYLQEHQRDLEQVLMSLVEEKEA